MLVPRRFESSEDYSYGFNGKERDDEVKGEGVQYDYGFRIYDARLGRFLSMDPLFAGYPYYTPYQFAGNRPIWAIDLDGLEELTKTRRRVTKVNMFGINVNKGYVNESTGLWIQPSNEIIEQGNPAADVEIETISYHYAGKGEFNRYVSVTTVKPSVPATDPNDNSKTINPEPLDDEEKSALQTKNEKEIREQVNAVNLNKVEKKIVSTPKSETKVKTPSIVKGSVISKNMNGLLYPHVDNSGFEFKDRNVGFFPGKDYLQGIVDKVNNSPGINTITISGEVFHGSGTSTGNTRASFYTGLLKLNNILKDLGLNKNVKVNVDYNNTRATKSETNTGVKVNFLFE